MYKDSKYRLFCCIFSLRNPVSFSAPSPTTSTPTFRITLPFKTVNQQCKYAQSGEETEEINNKLIDYNTRGGVLVLTTSEPDYAEC